MLVVNQKITVIRNGCDEAMLRLAAKRINYALNQRDALPNVIDLKQHLAESLKVSLAVMQVHESSPLIVCPGQQSALDENEDSGTWDVAVRMKGFHY